MKTTAHLICLLALPLSLSAAAIDYIGRATIPGSSIDKSGLTGTITWPTGSMPHNQLGGFGSGIAYTGRANIFVGVNDRGPGDGAASPYYYDRFQVFSLTPDLATKNIEFKLQSTPLMVTETGLHFNGNASDFNTITPAATLRFDPEGVRTGYDGTYYVSDEYGPYIYQFDANGTRIRTIELPSKYGVSNPNADANIELTNISGRQTNRGMEGLAITPDGKYAYGMMQNALIQDGGLNANLSRVGINNRIIKIDLTTGETSEYVYQLDGISNGRGTNEILAINDHEFLVLERDNKTFASSGTVRKNIFKIDVSGATDVSNIDLPATGTGGNTPVSKSLFLNLMDYPEFAGDFPEKIEGLSFGPLLADGRLPLYVTSDNDFLAAQDSLIYGFAIDLKATGLNYQAQQFAPEPATFAMAGAAIVCLLVGRAFRGARSRRR